eukprot:TRINITY_DN5071_c0_g1_i1.p1 TRINITY_DN5071_c0_g1~~TRINITY_DN5071_c0_g1_i1.p1  ORF type:complete len:647 (-),score=171.47 TRINITY_DN5071_c0_g1_i1:52-1992(-)
MKDTKASSLKNSPASKPSFSSSSTSSSNAVKENAPNLVRIFLDRETTTPLAVFKPPVSIAFILSALGVSATLEARNSNNNNYKVFEGDKKDLEAGDFILCFSLASVWSVKVLFDSTKLVVPVPSPFHQVHHLMQTIAQRLAPFCPPKDNNTTFRIAELRTLDNFAINPYDTIGSVIRDGMTVEVVEWNEWVKLQAEFCTDVWLKIEQSDFVDNKKKSIRVGFHSHNKLYLKTDLDEKTLDLFDVLALANFGKGEGKHVVFSKQGTTEDSFVWKAEASFLADKTGKVYAVELCLKSSSEPTPQVKRVDFSIKNGKLVKGDISVVTEKEKEGPSQAVKLPQESYEGPTFPVIEKEPPVEFGKLVGDLPLKGEEYEKICADQSWARGGVFNNYFYVHVQFTNAGDNPVSIVKIKGQYEKTPGEWLDIQAVWGDKRGFYNYSWYWNDESLEIPAHKSFKIPFNLVIPVESPQFDKNRRASRVLPSPLKLRVILENDAGITSSLNAVYHNPPYDLPTKASRQERDGKQFEFWLQADDTISEGRVFAHVARGEESDGNQRIEVAVSENSGSTYYYYKSNLKQMEFNAKKSGQSEIPIEDLCVEKDGRKTEVFALVDTSKPTGGLYALKFVLKTLSSSATGYYPVPTLKEADF